MLERLKAIVQDEPAGPQRERWLKGDVQVHGAVTVADYWDEQRFP